MQELKKPEQVCRERVSGGTNMSAGWQPIGVRFSKHMEKTEGIGSFETSGGG